MLEATTLKTLMDYFHTDNPQDVFDALQVDVQFAYPDSTLPPVQILPDGTWFGHDGSHFRMIKNEFCTYSHCISRPLENAEDIADLEKYDKWPDANNYDWAHYSEKIGNLHEKCVIKLPSGGLYECAWKLRGQEQFLIDMYENPEIPHYIMEKECNFWCDYVRKAMEAAGMDFQYIKDTRGHNLCFHDGIDIQGVLPNGTPDEVRAEVKRAVNILGKDGGYILCASHNIQNDTPVENILAMYDVSIR